ncbi:50S ribosome-binding GTPase [bacterium]|nr:50S ribosome-binding GTPase [bacterium]
MVEALLAQVQQAGAKAVTWQELLRTEGKSEVCIEATEALTRCRTSRAAAVLLDQANGALDRAIEKIASSSDHAAARELLSWQNFGLHLTEPWKILLVGPPNVGKSSLLNAILGHERAIVSPTAGTTRDVVHGETSIDGWSFVFADGAGIRSTEDEIERAGISLIQRAMINADMCLIIQDLSIPKVQNELIPYVDHDHLTIGNKADLGSPWSRDERDQLDQCVSARTGQGVDDLLQQIVRRLVPRIPASGTPVPFTHRQIEILTTLAHRPG